MGTRSLTIMHNNGQAGEPGPEIVVMYRQMDGYPAGHGEDLVGFLRGFDAVTNGISLSGPERKTANGGSCLAAQIVAHFKDGVGEFYLYPAGTREYGEEYRYHVYPSVGGPIRLKVESAYDWSEFDGPKWKTIFDGDVDSWDLAKVNEADGQGEE